MRSSLRSIPTIHPYNSSLQCVHKQFCWLCKKIRAKTVLSKNIKFAICHFFRVNFGTGYTDAEFLGRERITYRLCFHLKKNHSKSPNSSRVIKPKVTPICLKTGLCLASFLDMFWIKIGQYIKYLLIL